MPKWSKVKVLLFSTETEASMKHQIIRAAREAKIEWENTKDTKKDFWIGQDNHGDIYLFLNIPGVYEEKRNMDFWCKMYMQEKSVLVRNLIEIDHKSPNFNKVTERICQKDRRFLEDMLEVKKRSISLSEETWAIISEIVGYIDDIDWAETAGDTKKYQLLLWEKTLCEGKRLLK
jgi:hypothetical protein